MAYSKAYNGFKDIVDNTSRLYIITLFVTGVIWAFIAVNNFDSPTAFKLALIYSVLLIFGFIAIQFDRDNSKFGIDTRIWDGDRLKYKLAIGVVVFLAWYLVFMGAGFSIATPQSVGGTTFMLSPEINFVLTTILGPLAEDIFFFGVINITLIYILKNAIRDFKSALILASIIFITFPLFAQVPNSFYFITASSLLIVLSSKIKNPFIQQHAPILAAALFAGAAVFPAFHSYAYQLNEKNFIAATYFGILMCLLAAYIGIMPVDIVHIGNNFIVASGG